MHGLTVGRVTDVRLSSDLAKRQVLASVSFDVQPERIIGVGNRGFPTPQESVEALVAAGWRATLQSASLITGQQIVELDLIPDAPKAQVTSVGDRFVIPVVETGGFGTLATSASDVLKQINQIPFKQIGEHLADILATTDSTLNGPEMKAAVTDLAATMKSLNALVANLNKGTGPALQQLPQITALLNKMMGSVNTLVVSLNNGYGDNTKFNRDTERLLVQAGDAMQALRQLAEMLARNPEALIKGRPEGTTR
jgi:paraquat-inducible protein B